MSSRSEIREGRRDSTSFLPVTVVGLVVALALSLGTAVAEPSAEEAGVCRTDGRSGDEPYPDLAPSQPAGSLHSLKRLEAPRRLPATPLPTSRSAVTTPSDSTYGRWLPGYRPATPQAAAALAAWMAGQGEAPVGDETPRLPGSTSNYADNLLRGTRVEVQDVPEEPITHVVRSETYPVSTLDLRDLDFETSTPPGGRAGGPASEFHHGSGMTWNEYVTAKELARTSPTTPDAQGSPGEGPRAPGTAGVSFGAITSNLTSVPPDPILAAGPSHLVAVVNRRYQVFDKTGTALTGVIDLDVFFDGVDHCAGTFDPYVDYDEENDRFVMGGMALEQGAGTDSYLCLAATATNDPTGAWHRVGFRADATATNTWIDFPHAGIGLDAIYIAGNMFLDGGGLDHVRAFAVDKATLYAGSPVMVAEADLGSLFFTAQPVKLHGFTSGGWPAPGTPHHMIAHDAGGNSRIWRWIDPLNNAPTIYGTIAEANFNGLPPNAPELGGGTLNDTGSAKWLDAEYRGGRIWTTRNVACDFDGGDSESCIDWIQVDVSGPAPLLEQQQTGGAYGSADEFRYYPDLSVDRNNNIAIGYTKSSDATYTEVWVTGREFGDAAGTLQTEVLERAGLGNYTDGAGCGGSCDRWGDYTGMTVDPDGCTFWYLGQYSDGGGGNWGTHIGSFRFDTCSVSSTLQVDKGSVTCDDSLTLTVTDSTRIDATTVSAQTTITTTGGDSETVPPGGWAGSDCVGADCGTWTVTLSVDDEAVVVDDGALNVADGETITATYVDPHGGHDDQSRNVAVTCSTRLADGGYLTAGGCEGGTGTEFYRDYLDGGEYITYTFGVFNPQTAPSLGDVSATLSVSGPASDKVTIYNPTVYLGTLETGQLTGAAFQIYIDPSIDAPGLRLSEHDFNLAVTSAADGYTAAQVLTQSHFLQGDDNIVRESECFNFESGAQGFVSERFVDDYTCGVPEGCSATTLVSTVQAPWTHGTGCGSETRDDYPEMSCDTAGSSAFMANADPSVCNGFAQATDQLTDDILYSPVFSPTHTGTAASGHPWFYDWKYAEWFYRSDMISGADTAMVAGLFWDDDYQGVAAPGFNEVLSLYSYFTGFFAYDNQGWDSGTPWDPAALPANLDGVGFTGATGLADTGMQWRWAVEVYDADFGTDPETTPATAGLALDDMNLVYDQYHADEQIGACTDPPAVAAFDRFTYLQCPGGALGVSVLDADAPGQVRVTVTSSAGGDSETFLIAGGAPYFATSLAYSTGQGPEENDGTLLIQPDDTLTLTYDDGGAVSSAVAFVDCVGGDVVTDGVAALSDNGDGDNFADANETVDFSLRIRNDTGSTLDNVSVVVASDDPTVDCILKDSASFGSIPGGGGIGTNDLGTDPFTFKVAAQADCTDPMTPPTATFRVLISADGFDGPATPQELTLVLDLDDLPGTITFTEDFSSDPSGFFHQLGPGDDDGVAIGAAGIPCSPYVDEFFWSATGGNPGGGYFLWEDPADSFPDGTYSDLNDSALYSPVFKIGATDTTLSFDHEYQFAFSGSFRLDGTRVDYRVNGGTWRKLTSLPYDGELIWNTYCNPLCNGTEFGAPCFTETAEMGEEIFNQLNQGVVNWTNVAGALSGLNSGDLVQFRWRFGSMNTSAFSISTQGGYGLDNVSLTNVVELTCDTASNPDTGCGVVFDGAGNLAEVCGDGDGLIEPTETWSVDVTLRNSASTDAVDTTADLEVGIASPVAATLPIGSGSFGTIAPFGATSTATYEFTIDPGGVCVRDAVFDVTNIVDTGAAYADAPSALITQVGGPGAMESALQSVSPLTVADGSASSPLAPSPTIPPSVDSATLSYNPSYTNVTPQETATQDTDPLVAENGSLLSTLSAPFTLDPSTAVSATVDWTSLTHQKVLECTRVYLRTPGGFNLTLKNAGEAAANPYDVLSIYTNPNGGEGQYQIGLEEVASGPCKQTASLSGVTMTVTGPSTTGSWTINARVALWDGTTEHTLKSYGEADAQPYDVTSIYNASGPNAYQVRLYESDGGGDASISDADLAVVGVECDLGCASFVTPAPPMGDGAVGAPLLLDKGAGPGDLQLTFDNGTCSSQRAVVVYGNIGDYSTYQGVVDVGCDAGSGPTAGITHLGDDVWFNVIWVNEDDEAGSPGYSSSGERAWSAAGLCGVVADDTSDPVCD